MATEYLDLSSNPREIKTTLTGKIILGITGGLGIGLSVVCFPFISPALRRHCLPYVPATTQQLKNVIGALKQEKPLSATPRLLLDIGSGDGRIVIEAAKSAVCSSAHGVELNRWLVYYSKWMAYRNGVSSNTKFFKKDLWKYNLSPYNQIVIFGVEEMMPDLEKKLVKEMRNDSVVIACRFPLPNLEPNWIKEEGIDSIWVYRMKR